MAEHITEINGEPREPGSWVFDWPRIYYFYCTCGACGTIQLSREGAEEEAQKHHAWVARTSSG